MPAFAPMPSASVSTATVVKPGFFNNWRKANLRSFITQRLHRVNLCCTPCRKPTGEQRDRKQERGDGGERQWISGAHAVKETNHNTRQGERAGQTSDQASKGEPYALPHDEFHHVGCLCAQRHAHAD